MKPVKVRNIEIGTGMPAICIPITARDDFEVSKQLDEVLETAKNIPKVMVEWRADYYENINDKEKLNHTAKFLRDRLGDIPLLFTLRSEWEGGLSKNSFYKYEFICCDAINTGCIDLIDIELHQMRSCVETIAALAKEKGVKTIMSYHNFKKTYHAARIITYFSYMDEYDCDIYKIALTPRNKGDVIRVLNAAIRYAETAEKPVILISMGGEGVVTRFSGEIFGSAVTFGCAKSSSAPGQIEAKKLYEILKIVHDGLK